MAAHRPLGWAVAATVAAVLLDPVVDHLARHIRRGPAVVLTFLVIGAVGLRHAPTWWPTRCSSALDRLETAAPEAAASIVERPDRLGEVARDADLVARVDAFVEVLQGRVTGGEDVLRTAAGTAPTYFVSAILTIFVMTYGPRIAQAAVDQDPDERRRLRTTAHRRGRRRPSPAGGPPHRRRVLRPRPRRHRRGRCPRPARPVGRGRGPRRDGHPPPRRRWSPARCRCSS